MGWTSTTRRPGLTDMQFFHEQGIRMNNDTHEGKIIDSSRVGSTVYAAYEVTEKATGKREVFALVILTKSHARARDGFNFSYKDMDESMGPCESDCPARILNMLTEAKNDWAREWRERCRQRAGKLRTVAAVREGAVIETANMLTFGGRVQANRFRVTHYMRRGKQRRCFAIVGGDNDGMLVRFTLKNHDFQVVA